MSNPDVHLGQGMVRQNLPDFLTETDWPQMHFGWVTKPDPGRDTADVMFNQYGNPTVQGIPILRSFGPAGMPAAGGLVTMLQMGKTVSLFAQQIPTSGVIRL